MDSNEIYSLDKVTPFSRRGDQSLKTERNRIICYILVGIILLIGIVVGNQTQNYLESFAKTKSQVVATHFKKLENVPMWKIIVVK